MKVVTSIPIEGPSGASAVRAVLNAIAYAWAPELRARPLPPLYGSGIRYQLEPNLGQYEDFKSPYETFESGWGDCDDLVIYRVAELVANGERAMVQSMRLRGTSRFHVRVRRASGAEEDPSELVEKFRVKA